MKARTVNLEVMAVLLAILAPVWSLGVASANPSCEGYCHSSDGSSIVNGGTSIVPYTYNGEVTQNQAGTHFRGVRESPGGHDRKGYNVFLGKADDNTYLAGLEQAAGATYYVPDDFATIQEVIDAAEDGDEIIVRDGTYHENIDFLGKAITVLGEHGPATTIIDGGDSGSVVTFNSGEEADSVLQGFTITNGSAEDGGGIYCCNYSSPTITNCIISNNSANPSGGIGGGIYCCNYSSPRITNCTINNNTAFAAGGIGCRLSWPTITDCIISGNSAGAFAGGIWCWTSSATIENCIITNNTAGNLGGGIHCWASSSPTITNCIIVGNTAVEGGGGIRCRESSSPTITNCTIVGNSAGEGGGGIDCHLSSPTVVNTIFWGDTAGGNPNEIYLDTGGSIDITCSDIEGGWQGTGNIDCDPEFVGSGDYHLTASSCCIDAGTNDAPELPDKDKDGKPRIIDGNGDDTPIVDMGAYEFGDVCEGDFDGDKDVDGSDLAVFAADFGRTDCWLDNPCEGDFDNDTDVNGSGLAVFAANFGRTDCLLN